MRRQNDNTLDAALITERDNYQRNRMAAVEAALHSHYIPTLLATIREEKDDEAKTAAIEELMVLGAALGDYRQASIDTLLSHVSFEEEPCAHVRSLAMRALLRIAPGPLKTDTKMIEEIRNCLYYDVQEEVRRWALAALSPAAFAGNTVALQALRREANYGQGILQAEAREALEDMELPLNPETLWSRLQKFFPLAPSGRTLASKGFQTGGRAVSKEIGDGFTLRYMPRYLRISHAQYPLLFFVLVTGEERDVPLVRIAAMQEDTGVHYVDVLPISEADPTRFDIQVVPIAEESLWILDPVILEESFKKCIGTTAGWIDWANSLTRIPASLASTIAMIQETA